MIHIKEFRGDAFRVDIDDKTLFNSPSPTYRKCIFKEILFYDDEKDETRTGTLMLPIPEYQLDKYTDEALEQQGFVKDVNGAWYKPKEVIDYLHINEKALYTIIIPDEEQTNETNRI